MGGVHPGGGRGDIPSTNPSTPGITTTPPHPKYQNHNITNTQMKMSENLLILILLNFKTPNDFIYKIKS